MARPILLRFGFSFVVSTASGEFLLLFFCVTSICTRSFPGGLKEIEKVIKSQSGFVFHSEILYFIALHPLKRSGGIKFLTVT